MASISNLQSEGHSKTKDLEIGDLFAEGFEGAARTAEEPEVDLVLRDDFLSRPTQERRRMIRERRERLGAKPFTPNLPNP